jgi:hypothetical protein
LTDGNTYCGVYITKNTKKKFYIHSGRLSVSDVYLNHMIYNLVKKYNYHGDYHPLKQMLDEDKALEIN